MRRTAVAVFMVAALCAACSDNAPNPVRPSPLPWAQTPTIQQAVVPDSHGNKLIAVTGEGQGMVNVTPDASQPGFSVETQVAVWKTRPNTTFDVKRAVDMNADSICTSTNFVQLPVPNPGPLVQLTTSPGGAGSVHVKFALPQLPDGTKLAVRFEVSSVDGSIVLRTDCFTVVAK